MKNNKYLEILTNIAIFGNRINNYDSRNISVKIIFRNSEFEQNYELFLKKIAKTKHVALVR